jgi:hypothetical protein
MLTLAGRRRLEQRVGVVEEQKVLEQRPDQLVRRGRLVRITQRQGRGMVRLRLPLGVRDLLVEPEVQLADVAADDVHDRPHGGEDE